MLLAAAAVLAGAATGSATGFGFALVASPALFAVLEPYEALTALAALGLALSMLVLADGRLAAVHWRAIVPMLLAALPGLGLGVLVLEAFDKQTLQVVVGVAVVIAALFQAARGGGLEAPAHRADGRGRFRFPRAAAGLAGLASGTLATSISISGPPIVLWLEAQGPRPAELRASLAAYFAFLNLAGGAMLLAAGGSGQAVELSALLPLLGVVVVGHFAGALAFRRLDGRTFRIAVLALVLAAGVASVIAGLV